LFVDESLVAQLEAAHGSYAAIRTAAFAREGTA
jgi:hypothetical protein